MDARQAGEALSLRSPILRSPHCANVGAPAGVLASQLVSVRHLVRLRQLLPSAGGRAWRGGRARSFSSDVYRDQARGEGLHGRPRVGGSHPDDFHVRVGSQITWLRSGVMATKAVIEATV